MPSERGAVVSKSTIIRAWFWLDGLIALSPPLYWAADYARTSIFGIPVSLFYFVSVSAFIALSLIAAYLVEAGAARISA